MDKQPEQSAKSPDAAKTEEDPKKKRKFWRPVVWLFAIFILLGVGAVTAYSLVTNYMTEKDVTMPDVVGKQYDEAVKALVDAGLTEQNIKKEEKVEKDKQPGTVLEQDQYAGKTIKANRPVTLTVAKGTEKVSMPDVVGKSKDQAQARLTAAKISTAHVTYEDKEDKDATPGTILAQNPGPDATIDPDSEIKLTVAKAVPKIKMPDLTDMPQEDAKKRLTDLGLKVNQIFTSTNSEFAAGHVIRTTAVPGTEMSKGEPVDLFVSKGPDAVKKTVDVTVPAPKADSKVQVKIVRNDARGSQEVINETITADKKYSVDCVVQKDQIASIQVYLDGKPERTITVPYEGQ